MQCSPRRTRLYRSAAVAVISIAGALLAAQPALSQFAKKAKVSSGPRAVGLVRLEPNGKARIYPVAIMIDGKFYDAAAYKAMPVPMALDFGVVYEAFKTGVSQGLLTISQPGRLGKQWIAEGTWLAAGAKPPETGKKAVAPVIEEKDAPPRLHRGSPAATSTPTPASTTPPPSAKTTDEKTAPPAAPTSTAASSTPSATPAPTTTKSDDKTTASVDTPIDDPNRPTLRRGKPDPKARAERFKSFDEAPTAPAGKVPAKTPGTPVPPRQEMPLANLIPAVSDATGPDPRSYAYDMKPAEETEFRQKMLAMASTLLNPVAKPESTKTAARKSAVAAKSAFDDVHLRVFDLSNTNEPVLVLSAKTRPAANALGVDPEEITLVARTNLEGDLRKLFFEKTDSRHLDIFPRFELIDAVDADGDGRGELLFRRTSDGGSAYAIYRATADQLWPLFEGTP